MWMDPRRSRESGTTNGTTIPNAIVLSLSTLELPIQTTQQSQVRLRRAASASLAYIIAC